MATETPQTPAEQPSPTINLAIATDGSTLTDSTITIGDVTGGNKTIHGDEVHGDKVMGDKYVIHQSRPRIPLQRPPRAEHFIGRQSELAQLLTSLQPSKVVTLCGPGGIGKTALAAQAIWTLAPGDEPPILFPDGILFYTFYGQPQVDRAFEHIALSYGEELRPSPKEAAQRALAGRCALLLLDGAEEADNLPALSTIYNRCGVLITSRQRKDAPSTRQDLTPLSPDEAIALLRAWGGSRTHNHAALTRISEWVGRLPLALRLVGRYLDQSEEDAADYVTWLAQSPLAALDHGKRQLESVPLLLERSLAQVSETARQVMGVVGLLALAPFSRTAITAALSWSEPETRQALATLIEYGLLQRPQDTYEVTHALIHTYARERLAPPTALIIKLAAYHEQAIQQNPTDFASIRTLHSHIMALLRIASEREAWDPVSSLAWGIHNYLDLQGLWTDRILTIESALTAAQATQNRQAEGAWLGNLGNTYAALGQVEQAIGFYQQTLAISQAISDRKGEGISLGNLGNAYAALGQVEQAIGFYQQTLAISQAIRDRRGEGADLGNLGLAYYSLGQVEQAIDHYQQALVITREIGDRRGEGTHLGNLGNAYRNLGQIEQAIDYYQQALAISQVIGDRGNEGNALGNLGVASANLGQIEQAIGYLQQALAIAQEIGDRRNKGNWLGNLGSAYRNLGQVEQAILHYQQALAIAQEIGDCRNEGNWLGNLGNAYRNLGQIEQAIDYYQQALAISQAIGDRSGEGNQLGNLGNAYRNLGQVEQTRQLYTEALRIFEEIKSPNADKVRHLLSSLQTRK